MAQEGSAGVFPRRIVGRFGAQLKELRETAGFTQEELAAIAGLSVHAISALERGERRRPQIDTIRALSAALDLTDPIRDALLASARPPDRSATASERNGSWLPVPPTALVGRDADVQKLHAWLAPSHVRLVTLTGPGGVGKTAGFLLQAGIRRRGSILGLPTRAQFLLPWEAAQLSGG